jgi:hypothetical protein
MDNLFSIKEIKPDSFIFLPAQGKALGASATSGAPIDNRKFYEFGVDFSRPKRSNSENSGVQVGF